MQNKFEDQKTVYFAILLSHPGCLDVSMAENILLGQMPWFHVLLTFKQFLIVDRFSLPKIFWTMRGWDSKSIFQSILYVGMHILKTSVDSQAQTLKIVQNLLKEPIVVLSKEKKTPDI